MFGHSLEQDARYASLFFLQVLCCVEKGGASFRRRESVLNCAQVQKCFQRL